MEHIYEPKLTPLNTMYMAEKYKFLPNFREFFRFKEMQNGITDQSQKSRLYPRQDEASRDLNQNETAHLVVYNDQLKPPNQI